MTRRKPNNKNPSPIPHGSIVRAVWQDEFMSNSSDYTEAVADGWPSPGIYVYQTFETLTHQYGLPSGIVEFDIGASIPHGTKGMMVVDHHFPESGHDLEPYYKLLYKEKTVWVLAAYVVLEKKSTQ